MKNFFNKNDDISESDFTENMSVYKVHRKGKLFKTSAEALNSTSNLFQIVMVKSRKWCSKRKDEQGNNHIFQYFHKESVFISNMC